METDVDERSHRDAIGRRTSHIVETQCDSVTSEEAEDFVCIPAWIAELNRVTAASRQDAEKCAQAFDIDIERPIFWCGPAARLAQDCRSRQV